MKVANIDIKNTAVSVLGTMVGVAAGSAVKKVLANNATVEGLAGNATNYVAPVVLLLAGAVGSGCTNDKFLNSAALGLAAVGGASMANEITGKKIVTLGEAPRRSFPQQRMRGVGDLLPGMAGQNKVLQSGMSGAYSLIQ